MISGAITCTVLREVVTTFRLFSCFSIHCYSITGFRVLASSYEVQDTSRRQRPSSSEHGDASVESNQPWWDFGNRSSSTNKVPAPAEGFASSAFLHRANTRTQTVYQYRLAMPLLRSLLVSFLASMFKL